MEPCPTLSLSNSTTDQDGGGEVAWVAHPGADEISAKARGDDGHEQIIQTASRHLLDPQHGGHAQRTRPRDRTRTCQMRTVQQVAVVQREQLL